MRAHAALNKRRRANYVVVRMRIEANAVERVRMDSVAKIESS